MRDKIEILRVDITALAMNPQLRRSIFTPFSEPVEVIYREILAEVFGG